MILFADHFVAQVALMKRTCKFFRKLTEDESLWRALYLKRWNAPRDQQPAPAPKVPRTLLSLFQDMREEKHGCRTRACVGTRTHHFISFT